MSNTTVRTVTDEEEEEEQTSRDQVLEGEGEDDEEEDEDFVPDANAVDSAEEEFEEDFELDMACEVGQDGKPKAPAKRKRPAKGGAAAGKKAKKKSSRAGGIVLEDEEGDRAGPASAAEAPAPAVSEEDAKKAAEEAKKQAADALWAEMNGLSAPKKPAPKPAVAGGGLDIKALLAKAGAGSGSADRRDANGMVTVSEKMDFCGQEVTVTKQVKAGSKEELAARELAREEGAGKAKAGGVGATLSAAVAAGSALQQQMKSAGGAGGGVGGLRFIEAGSSDLAFSGKLSAGLKAPQQDTPKGLAGVLASIDGKKKMSTMEKSRHDWSGYKDKQDEHTRDEMNKFAKDGYLEKMAFLARTDDRQAQVARSNRRRGMGLKD